MVNWLSPPDRREITLLLFCLTVYILAYNLDASLQLIGVDSVTSQAVLSLGTKKAIGSDGRKPQVWRDSLEREIYGDWSWDEGEVGGKGEERTQRVGMGRHGAMWMKRKKAAEIVRSPFHEVAVRNALVRWREDIPQTKVLKHVPGYTILDNVFICNGSIYLVADDTEDFPPITEIVSTVGDGYRSWSLISKDHALDLLGGFGGIIRGVSWMSTDRTPHNSTLLALWKTYSSLDPTIDAQGHTVLAPPHRLIFPHNHFFTDPNPPAEEYLTRRRRVDTGFHPYLAKAAFPQLTMLYFEDFEDYEKMGVPYMFERLVVADRKAASRSSEPSHPEFETLFGEGEEVAEMKGSQFWWEPVRKNLEAFFDLEGNGKGKKVVTYIVPQGGAAGRMKGEDQERLISALKKMERNIGCEVAVVYEDTARTPWNERMEAIAKSTVVLGVYGDHLMDAFFMQRTPHATLMELYPEGKFVRDRAVIAKSMGQPFIAWVGGKKYSGNDLPSVSWPSSQEEVSIDVDAVVRSIEQIISRN